MKAVYIPDEITETIKAIQARRNLVVFPRAWGLILEAKDERGQVESELMAISGPFNQNQPSFWLLVDMLPMDFSNKQGIINTGVVDLSRIDWLTDQFRWVPDMPDYNPDRHVNYEVANEVCSLIKERGGEEDFKLTLITATESMDEGTKQFFRAFTAIL